MLPGTSCIHLYPLVAVNMYLVSATKLLPVCRPSVAGYKGLQVDREMNSNYVAEIQSACIPNEQHVSGDMCPGVNAALVAVAAGVVARLQSVCVHAV